MGLKRIVYTSAATDLCDQNEIDCILVDSKKLNAENGITGILYFSNNFFIQYFEGVGTEVDSTFSRIERDNRHTDLRVVLQGDTKEREFGDWSMAYVPESEVLQPLNNKYMHGSKFNPVGIPADTALEMIMELKLQLPKAHYSD